MNTVKNNTDIITRADYLANPALHSAYYRQFVTEHVLRTVERIIGLERVKASQDPHLNDIPLSAWDGCFVRTTARGGMYADTGAESLRLMWAAGECSPGIYPSASTGTCVAKRAARMLLTGTTADRFLGLHPDVSAILVAEGIPPESVERHHSTAIIVCADRAQAARIKQAGAWRSMADIFKSNGDGKWCVDIALAYLSAHIEARMAGRD